MPLRGVQKTHKPQPARKLITGLQTQARLIYILPKWASNGAARWPDFAAAYVQDAGVTKRNRSELRP